MMKAKDNPYRVPPWTVTQLRLELMQDLKQCTTEHERLMCEAEGGREIREYAERWAKIRKLTPGEQAIAEHYGYQPETEVTS